MQNEYDVRLALVHSQTHHTIRSPSALARALQDATAVPTAFICPITGKLMRDPVTCEDGHTYDRAAIVDLHRNARAPPKLTTNLVLEGMIVQ